MSELQPESGAFSRVSVLDRLRACGAGAAAGATLVVVGLVAWLALSSPQSGPADPVVEWSMAAVMVLLMATYALVVAFCVFFIGMVAVGLPVWLLLERVGRRKRIHATIAGGVLAGLTASILTTWMSGGSDWLAALAAFPQLAIPGAAAGWTLHRVAYGRQAARLA